MKNAAINLPHFTSMLLCFYSLHHPSLSLSLSLPPSLSLSLSPTLTYTLKHKTLHLLTQARVSLMGRLSFGSPVSNHPKHASSNASSRYATPATTAKVDGSKVQQEQRKQSEEDKEVTPTIMPRLRAEGPTVSYVLCVFL